MDDGPVSSHTEDTLWGGGLWVGGDLIIRNIESRVCVKNFDHMATCLPAVKVADITHYLHRLIDGADYYTWHSLQNTGYPPLAFYFNNLIDYLKVFYGCNRVLGWLCAYFCSRKNNAAHLADVELICPFWENYWGSLLLLLKLPYWSPKFSPPVRSLCSKAPGCKQLGNLCAFLQSLTYKELWFTAVSSGATQQQSAGLSESHFQQDHTPKARRRFSDGYTPRAKEQHSLKQTDTHIIPCCLLHPVPSLTLIRSPWSKVLDASPQKTFVVFWCHQLVVLLSCLATVGVVSRSSGLGAVALSLRVLFMECPKIFSEVSALKCCGRSLGDLVYNVISMHTPLNSVLSI